MVYMSAALLDLITNFFFHLSSSDIFYCVVFLKVLRQQSHGRPADVWNMAMFLLQLLFVNDFHEYQQQYVVGVHWHRKLSILV